MAQYVQNTMNDVQQMMLVASEEVAAGITYSQQQLPPQHVVQMAYQTPSVIVIDPSSFIVQASGAVENDANVNAMTQPLHSVMQSQPVQQEAQQRSPNVNLQGPQRAAGVRTYSSAHQLSLQNKQANQRQVLSPQTQPKKPDQQMVPQQVLTLQQHPNQSVERSSLQQTVQQSTQITSQQLKLTQGTQIVQSCASIPQSKSIIALTQQRLQSPQQSPLQSPLQSPQTRGPRPRLLRKSTNSPQRCQSPVVPNQQQVIRTPTPQLVQSIQKQSPVPDIQLKQQNGTPESSSTVVSNNVVSEIPSSAESISSVVKSQLTPKRNVCENRQLSAAQSTIVINASRPVVSPNQQRQMQVKHSTNPSVSSPGNQPNSVLQQSNILPQQTQQSSVYILVKTPQGQQQVRVVNTASLAKQISQKQQQSSLQLQSSPQQQVFRIVNQAPIQQQCVKSQQQALQQQQQVVQLPAASQSGAQLPYVLRMQAVPQQQQGQVQLQLPQLVQGQQVQIHVPDEAQLQAQQQAHQQAQLQVQHQVQFQTQQQAQFQAQQQAQLQAQLQVQQQAQLQAQIQVQQQAAQQVQLKSQLQAQQQVQLQAQQPAQALVQLQTQPPAQPLVQLQTQQPAQQIQLQAQQQVQKQPQHQVQSQTQQAAQQQVQVQVQQQVPKQPQPQAQSINQPPAVHQVQLLAQQQALKQQVQLGAKQQVQKQAQHQAQLQAKQQVQKLGHHQVQLQSRLGPQRYRALPPNLPNVLKVPRIQIIDSGNVDQSQVNSPRGHNMYSGPKAQNKNVIKNVVIATQQQVVAQQTQMAKPEDKLLSTIGEQFNSAHVQQCQSPRILQCFEDGTMRIHLQVGNTFNSEQDPLEQTSQTEQVAVFEGVTVKDQFPTGVLQECVVSESGELMFADDSAPVTFEPEKTESEVEAKQDPCDSTVPQQHPETTPIGGGDNEYTLTMSYPNSTKLPESLKVRPGLGAVCPHCGIVSINFLKCVRCGSALPDNVKTRVLENITTKPVQSPISAQNFTGMILKSQLVLPSEIEFALKLAGKNIVRSLTPIVSPSGSAEVKRKRCSTPRKPRVKVPEEPEILTLSSDDEDKQEKKPSTEAQLTTNGIAPESEADPAAMEEPDSYARKHSPGVEGGGMLEQAMDGSMPYPYVLILCRTLRIGTYKAKPLDRVVLTTEGLEMKIPLPTGQNVILNIPMSDIVQLMVSFSRSMPVLFISIHAHSGHKVRKALHMNDSNIKSYYFDPGSSEDTLKLITLLPEKITEDFKMTLKKIVEINQKILVEIGNGLANEILVKSSPCENTLRSRLGVPGAEIQTMMIYPPPPSKGGISINTEDYACLGEDQFLNDVIIDFYLKYLMQSVLSEEDRERTHVFSSFFYKRLTSRPKTKGRRHPIEDDPKLTPAEKRHARVKTWTKNVNLFSKDFIIIPINENCHWFLAIVCFPGQDGCLRMSDNTPIDIPKPASIPSPSVSSAAAVAAAAAAATTAKLKVQNNVMSIGATTITPVKAPAASTITIDNGDEGSDRDEAEGDEEEMAETQSDEEESNETAQEKNGSKDDKAKLADESPPVNAATPVVPSAANKVKPPLRDGVKQPCILIFDSLVGAPRYRVAATLREYLGIEYKVKQGKVKEFSKDTIKGMLPKVPQQTNFTDCGLYLLQYVEMFFKDPIRDYHPPIKQLQNWFPEEIVTRKREFIVNLLHDLMTEQNIDPSSLNLPKLVFNYNSLKAQQTAEDEDAQARLAEADSEADSEVARKQMAELQSDAASNNNASEQPMEQDNGCENEETVPPSSESSAVITSDELTVGSSAASTNARLTNTTLKQPLVPYPESSDDSNEASVVKRSQCEDSEEVIERKKRKAE
ncbi:uncharacterized protein LOC117643271 isoform X2 [Thrips palmi]|uniref:Uncharacterized protein LOC117643271 isoform X2 n=1 Tax=Thrips palmi TaxID=161013 RepID=A0A6P8YE11_THRPL|nr:uncharacterized protein LOC117643271 isoform X2 [Thrips palmi]